MAELNRTECLAQFNKLNKIFTTLIGKVADTSLLNQDLYLYKDVCLDVEQETVVGTYDNFKIVNYHDMPLEITEHSLNMLAREKILEEYPIERQLSILGSILEKVADAANLPCDDLKEMNDFIEEVRRVNGIRKDFYANNPEYKYYSTEELDAHLAKVYEGGIQEYGTGFNRI
jgi:hypothetical protein